MNQLPESVSVQEQLDYYSARAGEYDQWWLRQGRYDRGADLNARWFAETHLVKEALQEFQPHGHILDLACGTGIWTPELCKFGDSVTALDGSAEMLSIAEAKVGYPHVRYVQADLFNWQADRKFDTIFFGFWLSHVPPSRFEAFWKTVENALAPGGRLFFVDSRYEPTSTANNHQLPSPDGTTLSRKLNDGREFQIYKVFYDPADLAARLRRLGWEFAISQTAHYFIFGRGHRQIGT